MTVETYLHVRDDALQLYGFSDVAERMLFSICSASGSAEGCTRRLSAAGDLQRAIALGDVARQVIQASARDGRAHRARAQGSFDAIEPRNGYRSADPLSLARRGWGSASPVEADRALATVDPIFRRRIACAKPSRARRRPRACHQEETRRSSSPTPAPADDFVGQERTKEQLEIALEAKAGRRPRPRPPRRPPGLARPRCDVIPRELGVGIRTSRARPWSGRRHGHPDGARAARCPVRGRSIESIAPSRRSCTRRSDWARHHRRQGAGARTLTLDLPPFAARRRHDAHRSADDAAPRPLRHDIPARLTSRSSHVDRAAREILNVDIDATAADEIARRARGTPRVANRILRRIRDVAEVRHSGAITLDIAREALELLEVDEVGLERIDRELLETIAHKFGGGPVGLSTLAVSLGEEPDTIGDVYEPYLLQLGFLQRTPRGRVITALGRDHIGTPASVKGLF